MFQLDINDGPKHNIQPRATISPLLDAYAQVTHFGSPRRFHYGLNLTDDPGKANFRSPIGMHYIRMIKYHYV